MIYKYKESLEFRLNLAYTAVQSLYWMLMCCTISFSSAYLSSRGYTTVGTGALLAISFLLAIILQQFISSAIDKSTSFNVVDALGVLGFITFIDIIVALGTNGKGFLTGFTFLVAAMLVTVMQPILNALNFHIERYGIKMNFGIARASGSFFFFIISLIAGNMMKYISDKALYGLGLVISMLFVAAIIWIFLELKNTGIVISDDYDPVASKGDDSFDLSATRQFIDKYKMFFVFLLGIVGFYFGHVLINNFIYPITANVGGDEANVGGLLAIQAIVELPAMIFFSKLHERFGTRVLLGISAIFYFVKAFATTIATSVGMLYFSMIFQSLAFAVFIPASVHLVNEIMSERDAVKGQAFITIAMTVGNLLSSLIGGVLIKSIGVTPSLWIGTIVTLVGVIISIYGLARIEG